MENTSHARYNILCMWAFIWPRLSFNIPTNKQQYTLPAYIIWKEQQIEESMQLLELQLICKWSGYHVLHRLPLGLAVMVFVMSLPGTHGVSFARLVGFDLNKSSPPLYVLPLMSNEVYRSGQPRRKTCNTYLHLLFFSSKNNPLSMSNAPHISSVGQRLG